MFHAVLALRKDRRTLFADDELIDKKLTHVVQYRHLESPILYLRKRHIRDALRIMSRFKETSQEEIGIQYVGYSRAKTCQAEISSIASKVTGRLGTRIAIRVQTHTASDQYGSATLQF